MPITKRTEISQTIDPQGNISVLTVTIIEEDGVELARNNQRSVLSPGQSTAGNSPEVAAVAAVVWTPQKVSAHNSRVAAARAAFEPRKG